MTTANEITTKYLQPDKDVGISVNSYINRKTHKRFRKPKRPLPEKGDSSEDEEESSCPMKNCAARRRKLICAANCENSVKYFINQCDLDDYNCHNHNEFSRLVESSICENLCSRPCRPWYAQ